MGDDLVAPSLFYADFPLWTLLDVTLPTKDGVFGQIPRINGREGKERFLVIFTDSDLAAQFALDLGRPDVRPLALRFPKDAITAAEHFKKHGVEHVAIDFSFHPPGIQIRETIDEFIDSIRRSNPE